MYLVEIRPGKEELYRSSDELALAIRSGEVDNQSRVYHRAIAQWISITHHPQFKAIVAVAQQHLSARPVRRNSRGHLWYRWRQQLAFGPFRPAPNPESGWRSRSA